MSSTPMDIDPQKRRYLLEMMSIGLLDRDGAVELKQILQKDLRKIEVAENVRHKQRLLQLINILERYIAGEINLLRPLDVVLSNV